MTEYSYIPFDLIDNAEYEYYKLCIDGVCYFDDFVMQVRTGNKSSREDKYSFDWLLNLMERFSVKIMLPKIKFRQIQATNRNDVFEFKKNNLRIYVIIQRPNIYIAMGGYKKNQEKDFKLLKKRLKDFQTLKEI